MYSLKTGCFLSIRSSALAEATRLSSQNECLISSRSSGVENGYFSCVVSASRNSRDVGLVDEVAVVLGAEELRQVERVVDVPSLFVERDAFGEPVGDHAGELVGQQVERRELGVRVVLRAVGPLLAWRSARSRSVQLKIWSSLNRPEASALNGVPDRCSVWRRLIWSNAMSVFVVSTPSCASSMTSRSQSIVSDVLELVEGAAEVLRPLEVLERHELDDARVLVDVLRGVRPPLLARHRAALGRATASRTRTGRWSGGR